MKILLRTYKYSLPILGTVSCVLLYACHNTPSPATGKVDIRTTKIVITQPIELKPADERKLDDVLAKYDKKLYFFTTRQNGKVVKVRGQGSTTAKLKSKTAMSPEGDNWVGPESVCPNMAGCPPGIQKLDPAQQSLHDELSAILSKY